MTVKRWAGFAAPAPAPVIPLEERCLARAGKLVQRRGYLPCRVLTGRITKKGEVVVQFPSGHRAYWRAEWVATATAVYEAPK